jgi:c-di-GMP-binding flagellar brake protein YcgR
MVKYGHAELLLFAPEVRFYALMSQAKSDWLRKETSMTNENRREFPRLDFDVEFKHWVFSEPSLKPIRNKGKNISAGGLCIMVFEKLEIGTLLKLEFSLQGADKPIMAKGKVMWIDELVIFSHGTHVSYNCGVEFVEISPHDQENISLHIMRNIKTLNSADSQT